MDTHKLKLKSKKLRSGRFQIDFSNKQLENRDLFLKISC